MTTWNTVKEVWAVIILISFAGILAACSTYKASLTLRPAQEGVAGARSGSRTFGESEMGIAQGIVGQIAEEQEMRSVPGPYDPSFTKPYRVLSMFRGSGDKRHVLMSAAVKEDRSEIAFVITDQEHSSETEFTGELWLRLQQEASEQFAGYAVAEDKSSTLRNPLAP